MECGRLFDDNPPHPRVVQQADTAHRIGDEVELSARTRAIVEFERHFRDGDVPPSQARRPERVDIVVAGKYEANARVDRKTHFAIDFAVIGRLKPPIGSGKSKTPAKRPPRDADDDRAVLPNRVRLTMPGPRSDMSRERDREPSGENRRRGGESENGPRNADAATRTPVRRVWRDVGAIQDGRPRRSRLSNGNPQGDGPYPRIERIDSWL